jgi:photosystem II stability/assembly factor-like uncharacterized protein
MLRTPVLLAAVLFVTPPAHAAEPTRLLDGLAARNIGPANMGGRIVDVAVVESDPKTVYVAAASGGLWKTTDSGASWTPVFDGQSTLCLGAVAVAPSDPQVVWVGSGEGNPRNSVSWGDGVYKSVDGGHTWKNMGLKETRHIGRVVIHPRNPEIVYVAALGHIWGPNKERGLFKTDDGGKTWTCVKFLDEDTGFIDLAMDPSDPDTLYAAAYAVRRDAFSGGGPKSQWGPSAGLYKTADGGKTWERLTEGLPDRPFGRCGVSVYRKDPKVVYAVVQTDKTDGPMDNRGQAAKTNAGDIDKGGVFRSDDKGKTWKKLNDLCPRPFYYGQIRVDPNDDKRIYVLGIAFHVSDDGGKTFASAGVRGVHGDHHALWIDPKDSNHLVLGNDGGLYLSKDKGKARDAIRGLCIAQFYGVAADMSKPFRVYGGLQDNGSWGGPVATDRPEGIILEDWKRIGGGDGFRCQVDPTNPDIVYSELQYGSPQRLDLKAGRPKRIRPAPPMGQPAYRFNWNTPMLLSPHNPAVLYYGGNHLFRSPDRGDKWEVISPDLTRGQPGPNAYNGHSLTAIAESPKWPGLLYAGADDGRLHVSLDDGRKWADLTDKIPGVPGDRWVTCIECSALDGATAFVTFDRHRNDDVRPYVFKTTDHGATWESIAGDLPPNAPVHVIRQSSRNRDLLFAGTEVGLFASVDGGKKWSRLANGIPPFVTVHDLLIHPRDRELVIGTHGRGIYVMDTAPLEEATPKLLASPVHLFDIKPATAFKLRAPAAEAGAKGYRGSNPPYGATICYHLAAALAVPAEITVIDAAKKRVATLTGSKDGGLNRVIWNLRNGNALVEPGEYTVTIKAGDRVMSKPLRVEATK